MRRVELGLPARRVPADVVARLAAEATAAPAGAVSLVRGEDIHVVGLSGAMGTLKSGDQVSASGLFCGVVVDTGRPLRVADAEADASYRGFDAVVTYGVRAYLGVPLRDRGGQVLGAIAVVDTAPRSWTDGHLRSLCQLAELLGPLPEGDPLTDQWVEAQEVLDAVVMPLVAVDDDGLVVAWNSAAGRLFGWRPADVLGHRVDQLLLADAHWPQLREVTVPGAASGRPPVRHRLTARHRDGHTFPVEVLLAAVDTPIGPRWCLSVLDATGQEAADRMAAQQAGFLHAVLESLYTAVAACDADGRLVLLNRALRAIYDLPDHREALDAHRLAADVLGPDGRPLPLADTPLYQALGGQSIRDVDVVIKRPDQGPRTFVTNAEPIRDTQGRSTGAVVALHEVTAARRAEQLRLCQLRVATALTEAETLAEAAPRLVRAVAETLGWSHVELWLGAPASDQPRRVSQWTAPGRDPTVWEDSPVRIEDLIGAVRATGQPRWSPEDLTASPRRATPTGQPDRTCTAVAVPIPDNELVDVLCCFAEAPQHDRATLTDHLQTLANQISGFLSHRQAQHLRAQLDRTRQDFIGLISHEMRTPLTSIGTYTQLLLADRDLLNPDVTRMLEVIDRNATSLAALVEDLLDLAALQSGRVSIRPRLTDLVEVLTDVLAALTPAARTNHLTITTDLPEHLVVNADPQRLRQVTDNLLSNAVKYSPDGGTVTVRLTLDQATTTHEAVLTITDTGIGIPPEERPFLFQRFYRASNARLRAIPGTGLGLVITHAIVEAHGGTITATHHDPGTTMTVRLPAPAQPQNSRDQKPPRRPPTPAEPPGQASHPTRRSSPPGVRSG